MKRYFEVIGKRLLLKFDLDSQMKLAELEAEIKIEPLKELSKKEYDALLKEYTDKPGRK